MLSANVYQQVFMEPNTVSGIIKLTLVLLPASEIRISPKTFSKEQKSFGILKKFSFRYTSMFGLSSHLV